MDAAGHQLPDYVVGLGSNLGERLPALRGALQRLANTPGITVLARSSVYESEPLARPSDPNAVAEDAPQPRYLNAAVALGSALSARQLLTRLLAIEAELGRVRRQRWGSRTIDLDILWGRRELDEPGLSVPHPELGQRWFALLPLLEVAPALASRYAGALAGHGPCPPPVAVL